MIKTIEFHHFVLFSFPERNVLAIATASNRDDAFKRALERFEHVHRQFPDTVCKSNLDELLSNHDDVLDIFTSSRYTLEYRYEWCHD